MKTKINCLFLVFIHLALSSCGTNNLQNSMPTLTEEERVAGLSMIWNEARNNFPFWMNLTDLDWDAAYNEALINISKEDDTRKYYLELSRFITLLRDGHTGIASFPEGYKDWGRFPIWFMYLDGKHYISACDKKMDIELFSEVININQMDVNDYLTENMYPYFWHEKLDGAYELVNYFLPIVEYGKELEITTEKKTYKVKATIKKINWKGAINPLVKDEPLIVLFESEGLKVELTNDNIAVITIPTFMYDYLRTEFNRILPEIENCSGYIIDVRNNSGGMSGYGYSVAQKFIKDHNFEALRIRSKDNEEFVYLSGTYSQVYLDQPLVILANHNTGSAAEDFLVAFDNIKRATIVGTASAGSTGQAVFFDLPGGGSFRICTKWSLYPNGKEFINIGVQPDIYAVPSIDDYKNNYDRVFRKGIDVLREKINKMD
ncbi:MAG: hypothetical protein LBH44_09055 [Treponema sp.]|nr:hypothetical protein [Treponema sp.]